VEAERRRWWKRRRIKFKFFVIVEFWERRIGFEF
jgi:hypothetical protein